MQAREHLGVISPIEKKGLLLNIIRYENELRKAATRAEHLVDSEKNKPANSVSAEDILRMERELEKVNQDHKLAEDTLGENMLTLVVAKGYVSRLFRNKAVSDYLKRNYKELSGELQEVVEAVTADARSVGRE